MTAPKQDDQSWRKRVDQKLNNLSKRMDTYEQTQIQHTQLTERIDKKLDALIIATAPVVEREVKITIAKKIGHWFTDAGHKFIIFIGQLGVFAVTIASLYWVIKLGGDWSKRFINIFNGNLS